MTKPLFIMCSLFAAIIALGSDDPAVRVAPTRSVGPRPLEKQTETGVTRDYLQAWRSMSDAFEQNRADLLDRDFIGTAKEKLADTIREQERLGIHSRYRDGAHDLQLVFYSPEGLSIQLVDTVEYDMEVLDRDKVLASQHVRARYVAVLTPTEVRWKVRVFQAEPE
ncbi:MAG TPA: hypothetical protein VNS88_10410 [Nitrospiraceae bacterium]|nr:hypothetical protein [Nitrospiraceae bacterium]